MARGKYVEWLEKDNLKLLEAWARDGLTDEQIANNIGIKRPTLYDWKKKYSDISNALKKGKEVVDIEVENALLQRALGYSYDEVTRERIIDENGKERMIETKRVTKHVTPDTTAQIFWLKNRKPDEWRDRKDTNITGEIKTNPFKELTTEELRKLADGGKVD